MTGIARITMKFAAGAMVVSWIAGAALGQTVEFRIVERSGRTVATPADPIMNFAVQARVVGGATNVGLGDFGCKIVAMGEPDASGDLDYLYISNANGTYDSNTTNRVHGPIGSYSGLPAQYRYLAGLSLDFNGVINASVGTFTNTFENQEIGLLVGQMAGTGLLAQTDLNGDGHPDTYSGTGDTAPIDPAYATTYMGGSEHFIDVYRFRYRVGVFGARVVTFEMADLFADISDHFVRTTFGGGLWGVSTTSAVSSGASISFDVVPAPATVATLGAAAWFTLMARSRRQA